MKKHFASAAVLLLAMSMCSCTSMPVSEQPEIAALQHGMPAPARSWIERVVICHHFGGEEGGQSKSDEEIRQADLNERQYRCDEIRDDEAQLRKQYSNNPEILRRLSEADEFIL